MADSKRVFGIKVSEKGAVMVTGLRRFPVTFYADEWEAIASMIPHVKAFSAKHASELKAKQAAAPKEGSESFSI